MVLQESLVLSSRLALLLLAHCTVRSSLRSTKLACCATATRTLRSTELAYGATSTRKVRSTEFASDNTTSRTVRSTELAYDASSTGTVRTELAYGATRIVCTCPPSSATTLPYPCSERGIHLIKDTQKNCSFVLRWCLLVPEFAISGTNVAFGGMPPCYAATRVLGDVREPCQRLLGMIRYQSTSHADLAYAAAAIGLRALYAIPGTDQRIVLLLAPYVRAMQYPVLT
eukprot:2787325-Rhodomonas_salina.3